MNVKKSENEYKTIVCNNDINTFPFYKKKRNCIKVVFRL